MKVSSLMLNLKMEKPISVSKMAHSKFFQESETKQWLEMEQKLPAPNGLPQQQIFYQLESNSIENPNFARENHSAVQHLPFTYIVSTNKNLTFADTKTIVKPVSYVLNQNILTKPVSFCAISGNNESFILSESQKVLYVEDFHSNYMKTKPPCSEVKDVVEVETQETIPINRYENNTDATDEKLFFQQNDTNNQDPPKTLMKISKSGVNKNKIAVECSKKKSRKESVDECKIQSKAISGSKKNLKKKKKVKTKLKNGNSFLKKKTFQFNSLESDQRHESKIAKLESNRNLFELTKLEDNISQVAERLSHGCDCTEANCFEGLKPDKVFKHRLNIADLTKAEHDMYLMGVITASFQNLEETSRHKERIRIRSCYAYQGKKVCLTAFLYLQHVTLYQMKRLRSHLKTHGVSPRIHGNCGRKPANTFSLDIYHRAMTFVQDYIEKHCIKSIPNFTTFAFSKNGSNLKTGTNYHNSKLSKRLNKLKIPNKINSYHLPSECTKKTVHREYKTFCENMKPSQKAMKYSTFTSFLQKQFPNVKFHKLEKKQIESYQKKETSKKSEALKIPKKVLEDQENEVDKRIQTQAVIYIPNKTVQVPQQATIMVTAKQDDQDYNRNEQLYENPLLKSSQIVISGKNLQVIGSGNGNDFSFSNCLLIGNSFNNSQYVGRISDNVHVFNSHSRV